MTLRGSTLLLGTCGVIYWSSLHSVTTIISDTFNIAGNGTGFALNTAVNSGINPLTMAGTAKANLR